MPVTVPNPIVVTPPPVHVLPNNPFGDEDFQKRFEAARAADDAAAAAAEAAKAKAAQPEKTAVNLDDKATDKSAEKLPEKTAEAKEEPEKAAPEKTSAVPDLEHGTTKEENLGILRKQRDAARADIKRLTEQLEVAKSGGAEAKKLQERIEKLEQQLAVADITGTDWFKDKYDNRLEVEIKTAQSFVPDESKGKLEAVLRMRPGKERTTQALALADELSPGQASAVMNYVDLTARIMEAREADVANARQLRENIITENQRRSQKQISELTETFDAMAMRARDAEKGVPIYQDKADDPTWNAEINKAVDVARAIFTGQLPPAEIAKAALWAARIPAILAQVTRLESELAARDETIAKLKSVTPSPGGAGGTDKDAVTEPGVDEDYGAAVARRASKSGVFQR